MDQSPNITPDVQADSQSLRREELVQLAVLEIRELWSEDKADSALAQFRQLHPVDQGEVLVSMPEGTQLLLLDALSPAETADILEEMEPSGGGRNIKGNAAQKLGTYSPTNRSRRRRRHSTAFARGKSVRNSSGHVKWSRR